MRNKSSVVGGGKKVARNGEVKKQRALGIGDGDGEKGSCQLIEKKRVNDFKRRLSSYKNRGKRRSLTYGGLKERGERVGGGRRKTHALPGMSKGRKRVSTQISQSSTL